MTPRERLLAALRLEEPDKIPLQPFSYVDLFKPERWPTDPKWRSLVELEWKYSDPFVSASFGESRNFFYTAYPVKIRSENHVEADMQVSTTVVETPKGPLTEISRRPVEVPWGGRRTKAFVENDEELKRFLSIPYVPVRPDITPFFELVNKVGERGLVQAGVTEPIRLVWMLTDQQGLIMRYYRDKKSVVMLEDMFLERITDYLEYILGKGVGPLFSVAGPEFVSAPLFGPNEFAEMVVKYEGGIAKIVHEYNGLVWVHCHGGIRRVLDHFISTGIDGLQPIDTPPYGDTSLEEARRKLQGKVCMIGGIQVGDIYKDPKEVVEQKVREVIYKWGSDGFILGLSADLYSGIDDVILEKLKAIIDIHIKYNTFPKRAVEE